MRRANIDFRELGAKMETRDKDVAVGELASVIQRSPGAEAVYRRISRPKNHEITELEAGDGF